MVDLSLESSVFLERNGFEEKGHKETYRKQGAFRRDRQADRIG